MEPERWRKIERLYYSALNEEKSARAAFLEQSCGKDEALRRAVELLLAQHEKDDNFLESPPMGVVAEYLARQADALLSSAHGRNGRPVRIGVLRVASAPGKSNSPR